MSQLKCCPRCGNKVLSDDSYYFRNKPIIVIGCPICGHRNYLSDKETEMLMNTIKESE